MLSKNKKRKKLTRKSFALPSFCHTCERCWKMLSSRAVAALQKCSGERHGSSAEGTIGERARDGRGGVLFLRGWGDR